MGQNPIPAVEDGAPCRGRPVWRSCASRGLRRDLWCRNCAASAGVSPSADGEHLGDSAESDPLTAAVVARLTRQARESIEGRAAFERRVGRKSGKPLKPVEVDPRVLLALIARARPLGGSDA